MRAQATSENMSSARAYQQMLIDPCRAPLDYAPYDSARLDFVTRRRSTGVSGTEANVVAFWHPSLGCFSYANATGGGTGPLTFNGALSPFLSSTNQTMRPVAGCFSVEWISSESARQGYISSGIVSGTLVSQALAYNTSFTAFSIDAWAKLLSHTERMPIDKFEINWVPGPKDAASPASYPGDQFGSTTENAAWWKAELEGRNFVAIVLSNIGSSNVLNSVTAICEVGQNANSNVTTNAASVSRPKFDYVGVIASLQAKDPSWYVNTFKKVAAFGAGALGAYTGGGLPGILGYLTMGKDQTTRAATRNFTS